MRRRTEHEWRIIDGILDRILVVGVDGLSEHQLSVLDAASRFEKLPIPTAGTIKWLINFLDNSLIKKFSSYNSGNVQNILVFENKTLVMLFRIKSAHKEIQQVEINSEVFDLLEDGFSLTQKESEEEILKVLSKRFKLVSDSPEIIRINNLRAQE